MHTENTINYIYLNKNHQENRSNNKTNPTCFPHGRREDHIRILQKPPGKVKISKGCYFGFICLWYQLDYANLTATTVNLTSVEGFFTIFCYLRWLSILCRYRFKLLFIRDDLLQNLYFEYICWGTHIMSVHVFSS